jgi:hypothetical protein
VANIGNWTTYFDLGFDSRRGAGNFSLNHHVHNGSGAHPASYPKGNRSSFPGGEADNSPPSSAEVKEWVELYFHSPNTPSWRGAQLNHRDNFTFTFYLLPLCVPEQNTNKTFLSLFHSSSVYMLEMQTVEGKTEPPFEPMNLFQRCLVFDWLRPWSILRAVTDSHLCALIHSFYILTPK